MTPLLKFEIAVCFSCFLCKLIHGHWRGLISRNRSVWPTLFLLDVFTALKALFFLILGLRIFFQNIKVGGGKKIKIKITEIFFFI